jgi:hypothetical protein
MGPSFRRLRTKQTCPTRLSDCCWHFVARASLIIARSPWKASPVQQDDGDSVERVRLRYCLTAKRRPFRRAPNATEVLLFRRGSKILRAMEPAVRGVDNELAISKGAQTFLRPFPFSRPHTRKGASDYRVPRGSCSARFNASIWNGFLRVGRSR